MAKRKTLHKLGGFDPEGFNRPEWCPMCGGEGHIEFYTGRGVGREWLEPETDTAVCPFCQGFDKLPRGAIIATALENLNHGTGNIEVDSFHLPFEEVAEDMARWMKEIPEPPERAFAIAVALFGLTDYDQIETLASAVKNFVEFDAFYAADLAERYSKFCGRAA